MKYILNNDNLEVVGKQYLQGVGGYDGTNPDTSSDIATYLPNMVNITYDELVALRDNSKLIPGQQYRITDYMTITKLVDTQSAGHQFDIIVTADDESTLNEVARAIQHDGDTYFTDSDLNAWQIWYCLDNDTSRFAWTDDKIRAYVRYYDDSTEELVVEPIREDMTIDDMKVLYFHEKENGTQLFIREDWSVYDESEREIGVCQTISSLGKGVIYRMIDERGNDCPYDFKNIQFKHPNDTATYPNYYYTFSTVINGIVTDYSLSNSRCFNNIIKEHIASTIQQLNNNVFINTTNETSNCYNNSFGNDCWYNSFGNNCYNNSFGDSCFINSFGNECYNNSFRNGCFSNSFGSDCCNNSFGSDCWYNSFRIGNSKDADLRNYCYYNHFDDGCSYNIIWNADTASSSYKLQNININRGVTGTASSYNYINIDVLNSVHEIEVYNDSTGKTYIDSAPIALTTNDIDLIWDSYFIESDYGSASAVAAEESINSIGIGDYDENIIE